MNMETHTKYIDYEHTVMKLDDYLEGNTLCKDTCMHYPTKCYRCCDGDKYKPVDEDMIIKVKCKK